MAKYVEPVVGVMIDIETLATSSRSLVTQVALVPWRLEDPEDREGRAMNILWDHLPIQPQLSLIPPRDISASTLNFWINQSDEARAQLSESMGEDFSELPALLRHVVRGFNWMTENGTVPYEIWARGPQFDIANLESLMKECGIEVPWRYDSVRDLRTLMAAAGISTDDVAKPTGWIPHQAVWDCHYQIECHTAAKSALRKL